MLLYCLYKFEVYGMGMAEGFGEIVKGIDLADQERSLREQKDLYLMGINRSIVGTGLEVTHAGIVTPENLIDMAAGTIERHVRLLERLGISETVVEEGNHPHFSVTSERVPIFAGIDVALRQSAHGTIDAGGFSEHARTHGLPSAISAFASPITTSVVGLPLGRNPVKLTDVSMTLANPKFEDPEEEFKTMWKKLHIFLHEHPVYCQDL